jgi:hypothetical protein
MSQQSDPPQFMLLLRQAQSGPAPTAEELRHIMARFEHWINGLKAKGILVGNNGLENRSKILRSPRGASVTDGPFPETKEIVGGYIITTADDLDQAVEIARDCPGLDYQLAVEVRPVIPRAAAKPV